MRAKEFTINVPINIKINGDGDPEIDMPGQAEPETPELHQNPVMVSPLQQELELKKAEAGKDSPVLDKITVDDELGQEEPPQEEPANNTEVDDELLARIKALISR
jgi:hypothetical protein